MYSNIENFFFDRISLLSLLNRATFVCMVDDDL